VGSDRVAANKGEGRYKGTGVRRKGGDKFGRQGTGLRKKEKVGHYTCDRGEKGGGEKIGARGSTNS